MTIKTSGRSALILATGFFACFAGAPSKAAEDAAVAATSSKSDIVGPPVALHQSAGQGTHPKKHTHRSPSAAAETSTGKKTDPGSNDDGSSPMPPSVANANAQLATTDTPTVNAAKAMAARAKDILQTAPDQPVESKSSVDTQVVSADQLNDLDRALQPASPPAVPAVAMASAEAPPPSVVSLGPLATGTDETSVWDKTSLIGKIFIGFGALLTMASAARMFMA
jgi:hypothetical protein